MHEDRKKYRVEESRGLEREIGRERKRGDTCKGEKRERTRKEPKGERIFVCY